MLVIIPKLIKPGTNNQEPRKYLEVGPRGGAVPHPRTVTIDPGDRLPPTQKKREWKKKKHSHYTKSKVDYLVLCKKT